MQTQFSFRMGKSVDQSAIILSALAKREYFDFYEALCQEILDYSRAWSNETIYFSVRRSKSSDRVEHHVVFCVIILNTESMR